MEFAEQARISRELVTLKDDVPIEVPLDELRLAEPDPKALRAFLEENAFRSVITRLGDILGEAGKGASAPAPTAPAEAGYELVQDMAALEGWIAAAAEHGVVAVDTETTSLDALSADLVGGLARAARAGLLHPARPHGARGRRRPWTWTARPRRPGRSR